MNKQIYKETRKMLLKDYKHTFMDVFLDRLNKQDAVSMFPDSKLSCGTVGCIAARVCQVSLGTKKSENVSDWETLAAALLDINEDEACKLFYFHIEPDNFLDDPYESLRIKLYATIPGTRAYARICAKALDLCWERNGY